MSRSTDLRDALLVKPGSRVRLAEIDPAATFGHVTPLVAALGMSVLSLLVVGNAMRVARMRDAGRPADPANVRA